MRINGKEALPHLLPEFQFWYNHARPHQNLGGLTPREAWHGMDPYARPPKSVQWFERWGGLLKGYYVRC